MHRDCACRQPPRNRSPALVQARYRQKLTRRTIWQGHPVLRECWVSSKALELEFYPGFLEVSGWPPLPWLAISKVLKTATKKRTKQLTLFKDGKRARRCIAQFKIPRPARTR